MVKSDVGNNGTDDNSPEDKLKKVEALAEKLSKTDTAFGARFTQLMEFSTSISTTETLLKDHARLHKEELERIDKRLKASEKAISGLSTKTQELEKAIGNYKESVDAYIKRVDSPLEIISREQNQLSHRFNLLQSAVEQEHKLQKVMIWSYRTALVVVAIFFLYYEFCINRNINSINDTLDNLSKKVMEIKSQTDSTNTPASGKPNPNKK
jgi:uncharacterized protein YoxC